MSVSPTGTLTPCCLMESAIKINGRDARIYQDSIEEYYNSDFMVDIRKKMLAGEKINACRQCYQNEAYGGVSLRTRANHEQEEIIEDYGIDKNYFPRSLDLKINNKCNLKCRMCQPKDSNLIHQEFKQIISQDEMFQAFENTKLYDAESLIDLSEIPDWGKSKNFYATIDRILPGLRKISLVGGEPLIVDEVYQLLDYIIEQGYAKKMYICVTTNFMRFDSEKLEKYFREFRKVLILVSLDAINSELNYIRYPSQFKRIDQNIQHIASISKTNPNISFSLALTIQAYNALYIADILDYTESLIKKGVEFRITPISFTYLSYPEHLSLKVLPKTTKKKAIEKLEQFKQNSTLYNKDTQYTKGINQIIGILSETAPENLTKLQENFLYYTQQLDKSRGQRFQDFLPELFDDFSQLQLRPKSPAMQPALLREKGWMLSKKGAIKEAIQLFEKSLEASGPNALDLRELAWMYLSLGQNQKALDSYTKAYSLNSKDVYIVTGYANCLLSLQKLIEAKRIVEEHKQEFAHDERFQDILIKIEKL